MRRHVLDRNEHVSYIIMYTPLTIMYKCIEAHTSQDYVAIKMNKGQMFACCTFLWSIQNKELI